MYACRALYLSLESIDGGKTILLYFLFFALFETVKFYFSYQKRWALRSKGVKIVVLESSGHI